MKSSKLKKDSILLLSISLFINSFFLYGLLSKPIIRYHLTTPLNYNNTIDFNSEILHVKLAARNEGSSPARVIFNVRIYNMSLYGPKKERQSEDQRFLSLNIPLDVSILPHRQENYNLTLKAVNNSRYLVLIFNEESRLRKNPFSGFYDSFSIFEAERPNALLLKHETESKYIRVKIRR